MLACMTPLGEKGRGSRFRTSAIWFVTGGTAGGVVLGLCMAALAVGVHALAPLTGNPVWAVALGSMFGLVRGMSVLLGRHITTPDALRDFHLRFYTLGPRVGRVTVATELAVACLL